METPNAGTALVYFDQFIIVFMEVFTLLLDPQFVNISVKIDGRKLLFLC
jgi:hypothetical protein